MMNSKYVLIRNILQILTLQISWKVLKFSSMCVFVILEYDDQEQTIDELRLNTK